MATVQWAMVDMLRNPPKGFEDVVRDHFRLKKTHILKVVEGWLAEAKTSDTPGHHDKLNTQVEALKSELKKLPPAPWEPQEAAEEAKEGDAKEAAKEGTPKTPAKQEGKWCFSAALTYCKRLLVCCLVCVLLRNVGGSEHHPRPLSISP